MGMAASQARFLNLTARRTNIEYQGQQINQQRTELSNQSANLYNQMLTLQVPVPPNTQDYTKVEYKFTIPGSYDTQATVAQFAKTSTPGEYTVIFTYTTTEMGFPACSTKERSDVTDLTTTGNAQVLSTNDKQKEQIRRNGTSVQYFDGTNWQDLDVQSTEPTDEPLKSAWGQFKASGDKPLYSYEDDENVVHVFTADEIATLASGSPGKESTLNYYTGTAINENYEGQTIKTYKGKTATLEYVNPNGVHKDAYDALYNGSNSVWVTNIGTAEKPVYQYYTSSDIDAAKSSKGDNHVVYYSSSDIQVFKEDSYTPVTISRDGNNRVQSFNYNGEDYAVSANTITDDAAYNDAMNEYTYQSYLYEQEMNNINAQTSLIQAQDRTLELKLKQLDTEHNAVQTEMDAVKSVCKKNVEDSFKTFA